MEGAILPFSQIHTYINSGIMFNKVQSKFHLSKFRHKHLLYYVEFLSARILTLIQVNVGNIHVFRSKPD
jgi:hypothetical protein